MPKKLKCIHTAVIAILCYFWLYLVVTGKVGGTEDSHELHCSVDSSGSPCQFGKRVLNRRTILPILSAFTSDPSVQVHFQALHTSLYTWLDRLHAVTDHTITCRHTLKTNRTSLLGQVPELVRGIRAVTHRDSSQHSCHLQTAFYHSSEVTRLIV
jgi:hypothetical protein